jgi:ABC-type spermidine/putrescine transport system permease subunit I
MKAEKAQGPDRIRPPLAERLAPWALAAPALGLILFFFGLPAVYMLRMSFNLKVDSRLFVPAFSFDNYLAVLTGKIFLEAMANTVVLALVVSIITTAIAYVYSLLIWLRPRHWRLILIALAVLPLLISEIAVISGWWTVLARDGLLNGLLIVLGLIDAPLKLVFTRGAAIVGLVYITLPWAIFVLLSSFEGLDKGLIEASSDLGAGRLRTLIEVLLPLTTTPIVAAFSFSFIFAVGTFATPTALGPDTLWTLGNEIQGQALGKNNWPMASALTMVLVAIIAVIMFIARLMNGREGWRNV